MTEKNAQKSELSEFIKVDPLLQNMPNITLALFLLLEKNNSGKNTFSKLEHTIGINRTEFIHFSKLILRTYYQLYPVLSLNLKKIDNLYFIC